MQLDVWNNPIVVSALRQKYRRGSPRLMLSAYVAAMLGVGALLHHYSELGRFPFASTYLMVMLAVQFVLSGLIALFGTAKSINSEVVNQTLDFQRIVSLDPPTILLGKMLGEPATSYLLAVATIPIAVVCWAMSGVSGLLILCFYLNLAAWTLLCSSIGLIHPLASPTSKQVARRGGPGGLFFLMFIFLPQILGLSGAMLDAPGFGEAVQLLTPIGWFVRVFADGVHVGAAWEAKIHVWGIEIPSLLAAPVAQVLVAATIVAGMSRRLKNVHDPPLTRLHCYAILAALDLLLAGVCYSHWRRGVGPIQLTYCFFLVHYVLCAVLMFAIVPGRPALSSWVWRHCDGKPSLAARLLSERYEITLAACLMALMGVLAGAFGLALPILGRNANAPPLMTPAHFAEIAGAMAVVVVSTAVVHQVISIVVQKSSNMLYLLFLFLANAGAPILAALIGAYFGPDESVLGVVRQLVCLSPIGFFGSNMSTFSGQYVSPAMLIAAYLVLAMLARSVLARWLRRERLNVHRKLLEMGVHPTPS